jgi:hypothetical protein
MIHNQGLAQREPNFIDDLIKLEKYFFISSAAKKSPPTMKREPYHRKKSQMSQNEPKMLTPGLYKEI